MHPSALDLSLTRSPADAAPAREYDAWKAPSADEGLLIWPAPADLLRDTIENARRLASAEEVRIQNAPLPRLRQAMRQFLGCDDSAPVLATGHQTELHHPGVWVKNALIDAASQRLAGRAIHFAVDTDAPKHLSLRWPTPERTIDAEPLTDDPGRSSAAWTGQLEQPTPAHLAELAARFEQSASRWSFRPLAGEFFNSMRRLALEPINLSRALTSALHALDWSLGLRHAAVVVSPICASPAYLAFAHHVLSRADTFAFDYNAALGEYRRRHKVSSPGRPMPDLVCAADRCEAPFWLDDLASGLRSRATVERDGERWALRAPGTGDRFPFDPAADAWEAAGRAGDWLRTRQLRLSPRALTLTLTLRLLAVDQFVHGIGGGQYDQVADALIERHFRLAPPRFAVTTATLYFPGAVDEPRACLPCIERDGHRVRHDALGGAKTRLVEAIAAAPRHSAERSALFHDLHRQLDAAAAPALSAWETRRLAAAQLQREQRQLFDRELFYAIQPADRLHSLIDRCRAAMKT